MENIYGADQGNLMYGVDHSDEVEISSDNNVQVPQLLKHVASDKTIVKE